MQHLLSLGISPLEIQDLVSHFGNASLATLSAEEVAETLPLYLGVDRTVIQDPPYKIMQKCQQFCRFLKNNGRRDIVEALRDELPSGMTGESGCKGSGCNISYLSMISFLGATKNTKKFIS